MSAKCQKRTFCEACFHVLSTPRAREETVYSIRRGPLSPSGTPRLIVLKFS